MSRRADSPCTGCGKLLWRGRGSLPKGQVTCLDCRRARPEYKPKHRPGPTWHCLVCNVKVQRAKGPIGKYCRQHRHRPKPYGSTERRRARYFGVQYEPINAKHVYERDGWRCGICRERVNKSPMAQSDER